MATKRGKIRNCVECAGNYDTKEVAYWIYPQQDVPFKGLCEFCDPHNKTWYNNNYERNETLHI